jgi:protein-tyrosine phosphatase
VDSAGTGHYHLGEPAHRGTRRVLAEHGIHYQGKARQVQFSDLEGFDYLVAMDQDNLFHLQRDGGQVLAGKLYRLLDFASHNSVHDVPDPYYTGDFWGTYRLVEEGCRGLLAHIREQHDL